MLTSRSRAGCVGFECLSCAIDSAADHFHTTDSQFGRYFADPLDAVGDRSQLVQHRLNLFFDRGEGRADNRD